MSITLIFNEQQMAVLNRALLNLPYKDAAPLIIEINRQISDQQPRRYCPGDEGPPL
jgi:hypothetical protein